MLAIPGVVATARTNLGLAATNKSIQAVLAPGRSGRPVDRLLPGRRRLLPHHGHAAAGRAVPGRPVRQGPAGAPARRRTRSGSGELGSRLAASTSSSIRRRRSCSASPRPRPAIGKTVRASVDGDDVLVPATIVGVVEDTRIRTARDAIEPILFGYDPRAAPSQVLVRYAAARPREVMDGLARVWRKFEPEIPFQGRVRRGHRSPSSTPPSGRAARCSPASPASRC